MGTSERREREKEQVRKRILDAARGLFMQDGYESVSMRKIAEAIEYSPTAIYQYFRDKSELVLALCEADFEAWGRRFFALKDISDPVERLRRSGEEYVRFAVENPSHYRLMFMSDHMNSLDQRALRKAYDSDETKGDPDRDSYSLVIRSIEEAMKQGQLKRGDALLVAQTFWCSLHGLCSLYITHKNDPWPQWRPVEEGRAKKSRVPTKARKTKKGRKEVSRS